jgi:myo-inositol-1(or 4)-monophosphatase
MYASNLAEETGIVASADIIDARLPIAEYIIKTAGSMIIDTFHHTMRSADFARELIHAIESLATKNVLQSFPEDGIFFPGGNLAMETRNGIEWIIDPVDGIHNFVRGIQEVGVQVAIRSRSELLYASMYQPFNQEQSTAVRSQGAVYHDYRNGQELTLRVSARPLEQALIIYDGSLATSASPRSLSVIAAVGPKVAETRVFGNSMQDFTMVAAGRAEALVTSVGHPEDVAAGILLVREAGGRVTNWAGEATDVDSNDFIVSNGVVHDHIVGLLKGRV